MTMRGSCKCNNIEIVWHTVDYSVVSRKCQCQYCVEKNAAYVSKSGSRIDIRIHNEKMHKSVQHGTNSAQFHECGNCGELVFVTVDIEGDIFGALNANCLQNKQGFSAPVVTNFSSQKAEERIERWRRNWCHPVHIASQGT
jgi:hypothetical protein